MGGRTAYAYLQVVHALQSDHIETGIICEGPGNGISGFSWWNGRDVNGLLLGFTGCTGLRLSPSKDTYRLSGIGECVTIKYSTNFVTRIKA